MLHLHRPRITAKPLPAPAPGIGPDWAGVPEFAFAALGGAWADGDIARAAPLFAPDAPLRMADHVGEGPGPLLEDALSRSAAFPEASFLGEDAIWHPPPVRDSDGVAGTAIAARGSWLGRHTGAGLFGAPGGRQVRWRCLAELWATEGQVADLWAVTDTAGLLAATSGESAEAFARRRLKATGGGDRQPAVLTPKTDTEGPYAGRGPNSEAADGLADLIDRVMGGNLSALDGACDAACEGVLPGGVDSFGVADQRGFWAGLRAALPSASFRIEHRLATGAMGDSARAAIRWSLYGRHDGFGRYGTPSGGYLYVLGLTQAESGPRGWRRMWTMIDDVAIWTQVHVARGSAD